MTRRSRNSTRIKRRYRHPKALTGIREPVRDLHCFADVDRACEKWLTKNDPSYTKNCVSSTFIEYES
jgi:hypothetical protein